MKAESGKKVIRIVVATVIYMVGIGVCVASLFGRGLDNIIPVYLVNTGVDLFGMIAGYIMYICYLVDSDNTEKKRNFFPFLINITFVGLISDAFNGIIMLVPKWHILLMLNTTAYFMVLPLECYFFFRYITDTLKSKDATTYRIDRVLLVGLLINMSIIVVNVFTGIIFTVDDQGVYDRGPL